MIPIEYFLILGAILFVIGAYGVVTKSNRRHDHLRRSG